MVLFVKRHQFRTRPAVITAHCGANFYYHFADVSKMFAKQKIITKIFVKSFYNHIAGVSKMVKKHASCRLCAARHRRGAEKPRKIKESAEI